ncbi:hypothetical protein FRC06_009916 [Ceratobasidium sp. 370]|nr:hypothetical protein FRC06_009916 [Ceratobasidium sp. 370]
MIAVTALSLLSLAHLLLASLARRCTGTISSLDDVSAAIKCTTININSFTVPAGKTFQVDAPAGATVHVLGDIMESSELSVGLKRIYDRMHAVWL